MRNLVKVPPASHVLPSPPFAHDRRLMDATSRPIARHRESTARTERDRGRPITLAPRSSILVCSGTTLSHPRAPFSSAHLLRRSDSASVDLPCIYDRRQCLPRHLLHSRAPSSFPLVSLSLSTTSSPVSPFSTSTPVSVSPVVFSIPELHHRFPLSLSLSTTSSPVAPFPTSTAVSVSPVVFSISELRRRFPLSLSLSTASSPVATFPTPTAVSVSLVIFSILSPQHLRSPHSRP
ncbi:hypothetical protein ACLOJK_018682 [Asimina triloba]